MVKNYRKRCPVCGMVVLMRNLHRRHDLDAFEYIYRGRIEVRKVEVNKDFLLNFWISRLEVVLEDLRSQKNGSFGEWWRKLHSKI